MIQAFPKPIRELIPQYTQWIKTLPCAVYDKKTCAGMIDPHHVIPAGGGKTGSKVSDLRCIPLCRHHHQLAARREWFEQYFSIDLENEIKRLNALYGSPLVKILPSRKQSARLIDFRIQCSCGREHKVPASKVRLSTNTFYYWCISSGKYEEVEIR